MLNSTDNEFVNKSIFQINIIHSMIPKSESCVSPFENYVFSDLDAFYRDVTQYSNNIENELKNSSIIIKSDNDLIKYQMQKETIDEIVNICAFENENSVQRKRIIEKISLICLMIKMSIAIFIGNYMSKHNDADIDFKCSTLIKNLNSIKNNESFASKFNAGCKLFNLYFEKVSITSPNFVTLMEDYNNLKKTINIGEY